VVDERESNNPGKKSAILLSIVQTAKASLQISEKYTTTHETHPER
jgi:hypothetical protein